MTPEAPTGRVSFIGAGPGAADLITLRGARRIAEADVVVWPTGLVAAECIQEHASGAAELVDSARLGEDELVEVYRRAERERLSVVRVYSGDPVLWGAVQEQYDSCARMQLEVEMVPGVAGFSAAAAALGRELTANDAQSVVLTRMEGGKMSTSTGESVRDLARHGTTMGLFLSAARAGRLVEELREGGYGEDVPVVIAYKPTSPDELLLRSTLGELEATVKQHKLWRHTLFLVGWSLGGSGKRPHGYRSGAQYGAGRGGSGDSRGRWTRTGGRSSRAAVAGGAARYATSGPEPSTAEELPTPRSEQADGVSDHSDSDVAWWAVRDWQRSARGAARIAAARASGRHSAEAASQPALFVDDDSSGRGGDDDRSAEATGTEPGEPGGSDVAPSAVAQVVAEAVATGARSSTTEVVETSEISGSPESGSAGYVRDGETGAGAAQPAGESAEAVVGSEPAAESSSENASAAVEPDGPEEGTERTRDSAAATKSRGKTTSGARSGRSSGTKSSGSAKSGSKSGAKKTSGSAGKRKTVADQQASEQA